MNICKHIHVCMQVREVIIEFNKNYVKLGDNQT